MNDDRMVIRRKAPLQDAVLDDDGVLRVTPACKSFRNYKGLRKPKCNCMPCWEKWTRNGRANTKKAKE